MELKKIDTFDCDLSISPGREENIASCASLDSALYVARI